MASFIATECKIGNGNDIYQTENENRTESTYNTTNIPHIPQYMHKYDRVGRGDSPPRAAYLHTSCIHITLTKIYIQYIYLYPKEHMPTPTFDSSIHLSECCVRETPLITSVFYYLQNSCCVCIAFIAMN